MHHRQDAFRSCVWRVEIRSRRGPSWWTVNSEGAGTGTGSKLRSILPQVADAAQTPVLGEDSPVYFCRTLAEEKTMSSNAIPSTFEDLFKKRAFGHLATLMPDGSPQVTPVWIDYDGQYVLVNTAADRQKDRNLQRDGRVAISITDPDNAYRYLEVRGKVVERTTQGAERTNRQPGVEVYRQGQVSVEKAG